MFNRGIFTPGLTESRDTSVRTRADESGELWEAFANKVKDIHVINLTNLPDIKKIMTAEFVIDLSLHEIYTYAAFVHELTRQLVQLKKSFPESIEIVESCQHWLNILKLRNQFPLKLLHHQRLDGECDFRFSLQLMEGRPCGFKEIQVVSREDGAAPPGLIKSVHQLDCMAFGLSFAGLPSVQDAVLASLMEFQDVIFLVAKDQSDQFIGHLWGVLLREVEIGNNAKANVFWWMELARDPDFSDEHVNVGDQLRTKMFEILQSRQDWDFIGYQHVLHHKFHMSIVGNPQQDNEFVYCNNQKMDAKSRIIYDEDLGSFMRAQFIRSNHNTLAYPDYKTIRPAILKACWHASRSVREFVVGGYSFFKRQRNQQKSHNLLDSHIEHRLIEKVSPEKQACDRKILTLIIFSDYWTHQSSGLFGAKRVPDVIEALQKMLRSSELDFTAFKDFITARGKVATKCHLADILCNAIFVADSPSFVINMLLGCKDIPPLWLDLINNHRGLIIQNVNITEPEVAALTL